MTETVAALGALSKSGCAVSDVSEPASEPISEQMTTTRHYAFGGFLEKNGETTRTSRTYLGLVAGLSASASPGVAALVKRSGEKNVALANVRAVSENHDSEFHGVYDAKVPNKFYALIGGFARSNVVGGSRVGRTRVRFRPSCSRWTKSTPSPRPDSPSPSRTGACTTLGAPL